MAIAILFEDESVLAVEKPAGMPSQPDKTGDLDLMTELMLASDLKGKNRYLAIVNRLDRPVGGIVLFGKTPAAAAKLSKAMTDGKFQKEYLAVLTGSLPDKEGCLQDYLIKNGKTNLSVVVDSGKEGAKEARLKYKLLEEKNTEIGLLSLANITLLTGRHHQIRVQLANAGAGIFADKKYNGENAKNCGRVNVALWAFCITFPHPVSNEKITLCQKPNAYPFTEFENAMEVYITKERK